MTSKSRRPASNLQAPLLILPAVVDDATSRMAALRLRMLGTARVFAIRAEQDEVTVTFQREQR